MFLYKNSEKERKIVYLQLKDNLCLKSFLSNFSAKKFFQYNSWYHNWEKNCSCYLSDEHLSVLFWDGGLQRGNGSTILLRERESRDIGDEDFVFGVAVSQHLISERALQFRRKRVPRTEVPQELVRVDGARHHQRRRPVSAAAQRRDARGPRHNLRVHPKKRMVKV